MINKGQLFRIDTSPQAIGKMNNARWQSPFVQFLVNHKPVFEFEGKKSFHIIRSIEGEYHDFYTIGKEIGLSGTLFYELIRPISVKIKISELV